LNPTGVSKPLIKNLALAVLLSGGLIRALYAPERNDMRQAGESLPSVHAVAMRRSNISLNPTGVSVPFIVNLALAQLLSGGLIRALGAEISN
jgi:hypothetical protein